MGSPGELSISGMFLPRSREQAKKNPGRNLVGNSIMEPGDKVWAVETVWVLVAGLP